MYIELSEEEIEILINWFICYSNEGSISKDDKALHKKIQFFIIKNWGVD